MIKEIIYNKNSIKRVDKFIAEKISDFSRGEIIFFIKEGKILVNQKKIKPSFLLKKEDKVIMNLPAKTNQLISNKNIKIKIIFENNDFWVINKKSGLQVHPSFNNKNETLINALLTIEPKLQKVGEDWQRLGIVHRLDKDTSGVILVAKNNESFFKLKEIFKNKKVQKNYLALVWGKFEKKEDLIDLPIAKNTSYQKQKIAQGKFSGKAREAQTGYKVIQEFKIPFKEKIDFKNCSEKNLFSSDKKNIYISLVEAKPKTGRTHQIRVHLSHIGHPLVKDEKYSKKIYKNLPIDFIQKNHTTFLLHSEKIDFIINKNRYSFEAQLPNYFKKTLENLDRYKV